MHKTPTTQFVINTHKVVYIESLIQIRIADPDGSALFLEAITAG
jgi:hypothetical protein